MAYDDFGGNNGRSSGDDMEMSYDNMISTMGSDSSSEQLKIPEFQNFLKNAPFALFNKVPSADKGEITF